MKQTQTRRQFLRLSLATSAVATLAAACAAPSAAPNRATPAPTLAATSAPQPTAALAPTSEAKPTEAPIATASAPTDTPALTPTFTPAAANQTLVATPTCGDDDDDPTPAQTEGPYYTPRTPEKTSFIEPGMTGTRFVLNGFVLTTGCKPVAKAMLDLWHCDDKGVYDNEGYRLRGHFFADENGYFTVETIMPGIYPGRTRHFHVKVQAPNQPVLTTQLYFPNEPQNARDGIYREECLMNVTDNADAGKTGSFNFVLEI